MAASSSSSSSDTSSSSDRDPRRRRRRDERGSLALKLRKSHRPRAKRRRRHRSSHDSSSCAADRYRMDSQTNDPFLATILRKEQGLNHDFVGSSPTEIHEKFTNTPISQSPVLISSRCSKQRENFSVEDDNILVSGWLNNSLDAIVGKKPKHKAFWDRYHAYFHQFKKPNSPERSMVSLRNRWSSIQQSTNKFCGFFAQIEAMHPSGTNMQDQIEMAKGMYREIVKSTFHFEHCWNVLRHQPKWQAYTMYREGVKSKRITLTSDSSSTPDFVLLDENNSSSPSVYIERKAEKEIETKQKYKEISTSKTIEILMLMREDRKESHGEKMKALHELIHLNKEKLELEKVKHEYEIMMMATSNLSEEQEQRIKCRRAEIMAKYVPK